MSRATDMIHETEQQDLSHNVMQEYSSQKFGDHVIDEGRFSRRTDDSMRE